MRQLLLSLCWWLCVVFVAWNFADSSSSMRIIATLTMSAADPCTVVLTACLSACWTSQFSTSLLPYLLNSIQQHSSAHHCNFALKSGRDQWRRQDLVSGGHDNRGASIEVPKAPCGLGYGEGCLLSSRLRIWWSVVSSPSRVWGGAPAAVAFSAYFRPQNASGSNKKNIFLPKV